MSAKIARRGAAALGSVLLALSLPGVAHAANDSVYAYNLIDGKVKLVAELQHYDDGDVFRLYDREVDGFGVYGALETPSGGVLGQSYNSYGGTADGDYSAVHTSFTYNIRKGEKYVMMVCRTWYNGEYHVLVGCYTEGVAE